MSKIKILVYRDDTEIFHQECSSYLMATDGGEKGMKCSVVAKSEKNMRHLVAACMASAFGILIKKGVTGEDIDEFFKKAISEMFTSEQVQYEQVKSNEFIQ